MHLAPGSQVCLGCGLPLGAEATPLAAPAIEAVAPPAFQAADNPWRKAPTAPEPTVDEPAPILAAATPVVPTAAVANELVGAAAEAAQPSAPTSPAAPVAEAAPVAPTPPITPIVTPMANGQATVAADLATPASRGPLLAFDPLPPVAAAAAEDPYVTATPAPTAAPAAPTTPVPPPIPVEDAAGGGTVRGHAHSTEQTLAVPAAYATFAPEPTQAVAAYRPDSGTADVVALDFPAVLTVAPPQAPVAGWPDNPADPYVQTAEAR